MRAVVSQGTALQTILFPMRYPGIFSWGNRFGLLNTMQKSGGMPMTATATTGVMNRESRACSCRLLNHERHNQ
jgi:hypothetical protein